MAKKKSDPAGGAEGTTTPKKSRAVTSKARKSPKTKPAAPAGTPMVDTDLAAQNAARILASRAKLGTDETTEESGQKESGLFKQLKESLNRPATHAVNSAMGSTFGHQKSNLPSLGGRQQVAHNQTQGGFNRINVPRRTNG